MKRNIQKRIAIVIGATIVQLFFSITAAQAAQLSFNILSLKKLQQSH